jgi:hypothetical protein
MKPSGAKTRENMISQRSGECRYDTGSLDRAGHLLNVVDRCGGG